MRIFRVFLLAFFLLAYAQVSVCAELGAVINETLTPLGIEFHRVFTQYYEGNGSYNIYITEETGRFGSIVKVLVNGDEIYQTPRLNYAEIEETAKDAVESVTQFLASKKSIPR